MREKLNEDVNLLNKCRWKWHHNFIIYECDPWYNGEQNQLSTTMLQMGIYLQELEIPEIQKL